MLPKVIVVGSSGVGKSSLTIRFVKGEFSEKYCPTLEDSYTKPVSIDGDVTVVEIIDTAGADHFMAMKDLYYNGADGFILMCSVDEMDSMDEVKKIHSNILKSREYDQIQVPMVVCINKIDIPENLWNSSKTQFLNEVKGWSSYPIYFTSAKDRYNVDEAFHTVIKSIKKNVSKKQSKRKNKKICVVM